MLEVRNWNKEGAKALRIGNSEKAPFSYAFTPWLLTLVS